MDTVRVKPLAGTLLVGCMPIFAVADLNVSISFADQYKQNGFVYPIPVFSKAEVAELHGFLEDMEAQEPGGRFPPQALNLHLEHHGFWRFLRHPALREAAAAVS